MDLLLVLTYTAFCIGEYVGGDDDRCGERRVIPLKLSKL